MIHPPRPPRFRGLRHTTLAVTAAASLALAGCGSSDAESADGDAGETVDAAFEYESPIYDFLGIDTDFDEGSEQEWIAEANEVEQRVAACMREQGFEYTPVDQGQYISFEGPDEELEWGSREWTEKYGFGTSTQRFGQSEVGPDLVGYDDSFEDEMMDVEDGFEDPNWEYMETLSDGERQAYELALWGNQPEMTEDMTDEEMEALWDAWEPDGCQNTAWSDNNPEQAFWEEFGTELDDLYERVQADPRVVAALADIEACVIEAGHPWLQDEEQWEYFEEKLEGIGPDYSSPGDPLEEAGLSYESMTDAEIQAFYEDYYSLDESDLSALAEVQAEEIAMAIAYDDCGAGWQDQEAALQEVRIELEQEWLEENADRLADFEGAAGN